MQKRSPGVVRLTQIGHYRTRRPVTVTGSRAGSGKGRGRAWHSGFRCSAQVGAEAEARKMVTFDSAFNTVEEALEALLPRAFERDSNRN